MKVLETFSTALCTIQTSHVEHVCAILVMSTEASQLIQHIDISATRQQQTRLGTDRRLMSSKLERKVVTIGVASPGDVASERQTITSVVEELNTTFADEFGFHLEVRGWETRTRPGLHELGPQGAIDSQLKIEECDVVIGVFWGRFGSPVYDGDSGTAHEIQRAYEVAKASRFMRPEIMLYFKTDPISHRRAADAEQQRRLLEYKEQLPPEIYRWDFRGPEFASAIRRHLAIYVRERSKDNVEPTVRPSETDRNEVEPTNISKLIERFPASDALTTVENFSLAWIRVRYYDRPDSRDWIELKAFEANLYGNLEELRLQVSRGQYVPSVAEVKYQPKTSGGQRPIRVLSVRDRIVFQAFANCIASETAEYLRQTANRQSFANVLASEQSLNLFVPYWHQYTAFIRHYRRLFEIGNKWILTTDITAFYELIDHEVLAQKLRDLECLPEDDLRLLMHCLTYWASPDEGHVSGRGIPQGCLSSDLLANLYLADVDLALAASGARFIRYVDDVRLLAPTREEALLGIVKLESELRSTGLYLQGAKTSLECRVEIESDIDELAQRLSSLDRSFHMLEKEDREQEYERLQNTTLTQLVFGYPQANEFFPTVFILGEFIQHSLSEVFWNAIERLDLGEDAFADRHVRFTLNRMDPDPDIALAALTLVIERPWLHVEVFRYLKKGVLSLDVVERLKDLVRSHRVYEVLVEEALLTLVSNDVDVSEFRADFLEWIWNRSRHWSVLCAAISALGTSQDNHSALLLFAQQAPSAFARRMALLYLVHNMDDEEIMSVLRSSMKDSSPVVLDTLAYLLYVERGLTCAQVIRDGKVPDSFSYYLKAFEGDVEGSVA